MHLLLKLSSWIWIKCEHIRAKLAPNGCKGENFSFSAINLRYIKYCKPCCVRLNCYIYLSNLFQAISLNFVHVMFNNNIMQFRVLWVHLLIIFSS
jgi:hypothetical protein